MRERIRDFYLFFRRVFLELFSSGEDLPTFDIEDIKRILLIRLDRIGDLVCSLPAIKVLKDNFPKAKISILVKEETFDLIKDHPFINEAIIWQGIRRFKRRDWDLAIDLLMVYSLKTAFLCWLSRAKYRLGFDIAGRGIFFNLRVKPKEEKKHMVEHTLDLIRSLPLVANICDPLDISKPLFYLKEDRKEEIKAWLKEKGIYEKDLLFVIHPGGYSPTQRWPEKKFARLIQTLMRNLKVKIVVIGTRKEREIVENVINQGADAKPGISNILMAISWPLNRIVALIERADLFVGNNSGPLHIAWVQGKPTVSTMGPTDPELWWPVGKDHIVIRKNLPCSPCNRARCKRHGCMRLITVEDMVEAVETQLKKISKAKCEDSAG